MPDPISAISGGSALLGAGASRKAAKAQTAAANADMAFQTQTRDQIVQKLDPFYQGGTAAQAALLYEAGLGPRPMMGAQPLAIEEVRTPTQSGPRRQGNSVLDDPFKNPFGIGFLPAGSEQPRSAPPQTTTSYRVGGQTFASRGEAEAYAAANGTQGTPFGGFQASPGYQYALDQGNASINALAGAKGGLNSGATLKALQENGIGMQNQEYGNWWNRLSGLAGSGQNAAANQGTAMGNAAAGVSQAYSNIGNAQAAGAIGVSNAINGGVQNYLGYQQYQQGLGNGLRNGIGTPGVTPGLFGGGR